MCDRRHGEAESCDLPPELQALEAELATLRPRGDGLDRVRLAFLAGQASVSGTGRRRPGRLMTWGWPASLAAMTAVAASLLGLLLTRPETRVVERIVHAPAPQSSAAGLANAVSPAQLRTRGADPFRRQGTSPVAVSSDSTGIRPTRTIDPRFRLFEHLVAQESYPCCVATGASSADADAVNDSVRSVRGNRSVLDESNAVGPASDASSRRTIANPGANS